MRATKSGASHGRPRHRRPRRRLLLPMATVVAVAVAGSAATGGHTVAPGETLSQIASDHKVNMAELAEANGIDDVDRLRAGQLLTMPGEGADPAAPAAPVRFHTVATGDTLSAIARTYGVTVAKLAAANGIDDIHRIRVGDKLAIDDAAPGAGTAAGGGKVDTSRFPARLQASPERLALVPIFEHWAGHYDTPLDLLMAMTWLESGWQRDVVSSAGAIGIGQLMPDTVTWMEDVLIGQPLDPYDPDDNIRMSARYLSWLLDRTGGDVATALAGYYQGLGAVQTSGIFPSTRAYVANVLAFRDQHF